MAAGQGQQFAVPTSADFSRVPLHAANAGPEQMELHEFKSRLGVLVELSARQAEQQEYTMRQLDEQAQLMSKTMQAVGLLQSQVKAMRSDLKEVLRNHVTQGFEFEPQTRRHFETNHLPEEEALNITDDFAERVKARRGGSKSALPFNGERRSKQRTPISDANTPQRKLSEEAVSSSSETSPIMSNGVARSEDEFVQAPPPSTTIFNRSPPGLCLYSDDAKDDAWITAVITEIKSLIISDEEQCLQALQRTSEQVLNKADHDGMTLFHYAAMHGRAKTCNVMLDHAGFSAAKMGDRSSNTALHFAALHDRAEVCRTILDHDSSIAMVVNRYGDTPYDIAQRRGVAAVCAAFEEVK